MILEAANEIDSVVEDMMMAVYRRGFEETWKSYVLPLLGREVLKKETSDARGIRLAH